MIILLYEPIASNCKALHRIVGTMFAYSPLFCSEYHYNAAADGIFCKSDAAAHVPVFTKN